MSIVEVNIPPSIRTERFGYLSTGTPFMMIGGTSVYMKIDEVSKYDSYYHKRDYNTVCADGRLGWTDDNMSVVLVDAKIYACYNCEEDKYE